ncbi:scavenger receptor cysteine-rich domain superfamily protein-like [Mytilus californianus]|uniref:scavenger receptor cysteine-rich domain superfamily protein-like n=1 Tax=Mytilus californianus TaxID=6549 RepID=UPI002247B928|nr:scavenger receptor cysteine-rich domain superfamily protein-like [Mytilus californianus]
MICKMIGYKYGGVPIFDAIPHTPGPVWINYIQCPLDANDLLDCYFVWRNQDRVVMDGDISVKCRTEPVEVPDVKFRLIGPRSDTGKGRLEYFRDGYWGSVCSFYMGTSEASLFCHILWFTYGGHILINKTNYGRSDLGPVLLGGIECPWNSEDLDQCSERMWAFEDFRNVCSFLHQYDVELKCRSDPFPDYEIQLFGGNSNNEGQLLLKYHDKWSTVYYDHGFSATNVAVVCKQLGYRHGGEMHTKQSVYENSRRKWLILECNGKEQNVGHCNTVREEDYHYSENAVFIKCYETSDTELQMTVSLENDGKVIVHRQGETCKICAYDWEWDDVGATTVCRMLNNSFSNGTATHLPYELSSQNDPEMENSIQLLYCPRGVSHLGDCFYGRDPDTRARWLGPWGPGDCANDKYEVLRAGVRCNI